MNTLRQNIASANESESPAPTITIIYEDRIAGLRAKRFSDMLLTSLGADPDTMPACWRGELIDLPEIAQDISRDAGSSDFVILSLRGDTSLSAAMRLWIESWLAGATGGPASLVALFDADRSIASQAESIRYYLRNVANGSGVAFFAHCTVALGERTIPPLLEDEGPAAHPIRRRRSRRVHTPFSPAYAAA